MSLARSFPGAPSRPRLHHHSGDTRPWQRAISRRTFVGGALGATGIALTSGLWQSAIARAAVGTGAAGSAAPRPIPGGTQIDPFGFFHFFFPGHGNEPASITDFNGHVGAADVVGTGTGTDPDTGDLIPLTFDCDMRFMSGEYVGLDGISHHGTFGFI
jgi:hypothetical protein